MIVEHLFQTTQIPAVLIYHHILKYVPHYGITSTEIYQYCILMKVHRFLRKVHVPLSFSDILQMGSLYFPNAPSEPNDTYRFVLENVHVFVHVEFQWKEEWENIKFPDFLFIWF